jgi:hypothetical protein
MGVKGEAGEGTTFLDIANVAKDAAEKVAADGKVDAQEIIDAGVAAARELGIGQDESGEHPPLTHHAITELRKFLVPILTTLMGLVAGGAGGWWHGEVAKDEAVKAVRTEERQASEARDGARRMIREAIERRVRSGSWDDVGKAVRDLKPEDLLVDLELEGSVPEEDALRLATQQLQTVQAPYMGDVALEPAPAQPPGD